MSRSCDLSTIVNRTECLVGVARISCISVITCATSQHRRTAEQLCQVCNAVCVDIVISACTLSKADGNFRVSIASFARVIELANFRLSM